MRCTAVDPRTLVLMSACTTAFCAMAQPHCDIVLRPAFEYSMDGLVQFHDVSETYGQPVNMAWTFGDGDGSSVLDPEHAYADPGWYTACLTLTTLDGLCSSTYCRQVVVPEQDCGWATWFEHSGTTTNTATFFDSWALADASAWYWEFGDGGYSTDPSPSHMWALPGNHYVTLTRSNATCATSVGRWVEVDGNATTCGPGVFANFTEVHAQNGLVLFHPEFTITSGGQPIGNVWSYGDGSLDTAWAGMHTYADPGMYQVCMLTPLVDPVTMDSCFAYVCRTISVFAAVSIDDESARAGLRVWPVPFDDFLQVDLPDLAHGPARLRLLDPLGRTAAEYQGISAGPILFHTGELPPGAYMLVAEVDGRHFVQRVVRE